MYDTILVPTDGSETARLATQRAIELAATHDATLYGLYVVEKTREDPERTSLEEKLAEETTRADDVLASFAGHARERGLDAETERRRTVPRSTIVDYVEERDVDLVVIGSTGADDVAEKLLGSVAKYVVNEAPADVLVVRPDEWLA